MYFCISFTHKNTALNVRERLALDDGRKKELLRLILASAKIDECVLLSTCNRTEIMCFLAEGGESSSAAGYIYKCLALVCSIEQQLLENCPDIYEEAGFLHHLFSVASSLDSLVIGETQITGQLRAALEFCKEFASVSELELAINCAFKCAACVRNETQISKHRLSVSSIAAEHAKERTSLARARVLLIGSGMMARLCAKALGAEITITSRTQENAQKLAAELNAAGGSASVRDFANLSEFINEFDLIFVATSAQEAFLHAGLFDEKPRLVYDICVPKNTSFSRANSTEVISVDDLQEIAAKNLALKEEQARCAYKIIAAKVREFGEIKRQVVIKPIIKAMRLAASECADEQLKIALEKGYLRGCDPERVARFSKQLFGAFLHAPTMRIKAADIDEIGVLRYIFDVKEHDEIY